MILKIFVATCLLFISFYSRASAQQTYGLCSQVYQMYQYCTNDSPAAAGVTATTAGMKVGKKGPKGDRGRPGIVNYTIINSRIDEEMRIIQTQVDEFGTDLLKKQETFINETRKKEEFPNEIMNEINKKILSLSSTLEVMRNRMQNVCPIWYKNKCFIPVVNVNVNLAKARNICAGMSGKLANIYDMDHFDLIMKQIRANYMNGNSYINLLLGMTIQPSTGQVFLTNGTEVTYLNKWYPGDPVTTSRYTSAVILIDKSADAEKQYLYNYPPTNSYEILCEV